MLTVVRMTIPMMVLRRKRAMDCTPEPFSWKGLASRSRSAPKAKEKQVGVL